MDRDTANLLQSVSQGDAVALDALLCRYVPQLRAFIRLRVGKKILARETPDDLAQSVCRELLQDVGDFEYQGEAAFKQWLFLAAMRKIKDKAKFYGREMRDPDRERPQLDDAQLYSGYASLLTPSQVAISREEVERLERVFEQLTDEHREVITLSRIVGLSHQEIGDAIGKTQGAVRVTLHRAMARLGRLLEEAESREK